MYLYFLYLCIINSKQTLENFVFFNLILIMTRLEALTKLHDDKKITHKDFLDDEYLEIKNGVIITEEL